MNERTKNVAWITVIVGTVAMALYGWWRQKRSSIGSYADVKDVKPMAIHGPSYTYPMGAGSSVEEKPKARKRAVKRVCDPVEIIQESKSNTQILACHGEPLGRVQSSRDAYELLRGQSQLLQEELVVLAMDSRNNVVATSMVHRGISNGVQVSPVDVFRVPVVHGATRMIIAHNHPSGSLEPSPSDMAMTRKMKGLGDEMGIVLLDHVIVSKDGFSSLRDLGILQ